ncbi:SymE family type I addiction module toxin [Vibrio quintilis]|uniref:Toxic protein SymE n=1 Tax=Vibrio quintilis TaxID=1117707 RepID=A0A1M7Z376_9VIBR|nr:SymE family type I addiction module toxin [Vibrio quintilis]SHO59240.1 Toxic protein SymE [Vibrio quintilis]
MSRHTTSHFICSSQENTVIGMINIIHLKGKWLREAGFETGTPVTVNIAGDCIVLIPDSPQEQALREQLTQLKAALG